MAAAHVPVDREVERPGRIRQQHLPAYVWRRKIREPPHVSQSDHDFRTVAYEKRKQRAAAQHPRGWVDAASVPLELLHSLPADDAYGMAAPGKAFTNKAGNVAKTGGRVGAV
jgi:hypothetical protein